MRARPLAFAGALALGLLAVSVSHLAAAESSSQRAPGLSTGRGSLWDPLLDDGVRAGLSRPRLKATADRLAKAGISPEVGRQVLAPAFEAAGRGLPWEAVLAKIDEGLLKKVGPDALAAASRGRADALGRGRALAESGLGAPLPGQASKLVAATALALESGVPEQTLLTVLREGKGRPPGQVQSVVEAGESLRLAGFDPETVEALMGDCLARSLRREEVLRVVRFAVEKKRQGFTGPAIREALWDRSSKGKGKLSAPAEGQPVKAVN